MTIHAVNTCTFDENAIIPKLCQVRNVLREAGMEVVTQEYFVSFSAFLKLVQPLVKYLAWLQLGAQHYAVGDKP